MGELGDKIWLESNKIYRLTWTIELKELLFFFFLFFSHNSSLRIENSLMQFDHFSRDSWKSLLWFRCTQNSLLRIHRCVHVSQQQIYLFLLNSKLVLPLIDAQILLFLSSSSETNSFFEIQNWAGNVLHDIVI